MKKSKIKPEEYLKDLESILEIINKINLRKITEITDETDLKDQAACAGGTCEIV